MFSSFFGTNDTRPFLISEAEKKKNGVPSKEETKVSKERVPSVKKPEAPKERVPSEKKPEATKERVPSEKKTEVSKERSPSEKKKEAPMEKAPSVKEPEKAPLEKKEEVPKQTTVSDKIPDVKIEKKTVEESEAVSRERVSSQRGKPEVTRPIIMGVKPFSLPRDRVATETASRPPASQPRDRAFSNDNVAKPPTTEEPAKPRGPPKFGIGIGGLAGGGLLAEMKMRQEKAASLGRVSYPAITYT